MDQNTSPSICILYGPTAVGKTALASRLSSTLPIEIINMDVGQFYKPFSIGTAKPDLGNTTVKHHLFDVLQHPAHLSIATYRKEVSKLLPEIWDRGSLPVLVGGSGFYMRSLFFQPLLEEFECSRLVEHKIVPSWSLLHDIDPDRAIAVNPADTYRIKRALDIWFSTGKKPSEYRPIYNPLASTLIIHVTRDRSELYDLIDQRVHSMLDAGWINEVQSLASNPAWATFIRHKKLIGYDDILNYVEHKKPYSSLYTAIAQRTRQYAKRQETYWRMFEKELLQAHAHTFRPAIKSINLTLTSCDVALYIKSLLKNA